MPKLTPKEAFELIRQLNPSAVMIKPSVCGEARSVVFFDDKCGGEHWSCPNIDWGDATSYKPERWRPATIEDVVRHMSGEYVEARIGNRTGRLFGVSKPGTVIAFGVDFGDESAWGGGSKVEVRDE